jgi:hypothetical protein
VEGICFSETLVTTYLSDNSCQEIGQCLLQMTITSAWKAGFWIQSYWRTKQVWYPYNYHAQFSNRKEQIVLEWYNKTCIYFCLEGWQVCEFIPTLPVTVLASTENKTQSHLLVLEKARCQRMWQEYSWHTALGMTSHTDMSRSSELLHQTLSDGTVPVLLNCTSHI